MTAPTMWDTREVRLTIRLPNELADQAVELAEKDPDLLARIVQYGLWDKTPNFADAGEDPGDARYVLEAELEPPKRKPVTVVRANSIRETRAAKR